MQDVFHARFRVAVQKLNLGGFPNMKGSFFEGPENMDYSILGVAYIDHWDSPIQGKSHSSHYNGEPY